MKIVGFLCRVVAASLLITWLMQHSAVAQQGFNLPDDVTERTVDIYSEGTRLTAHIFTPKSADRNDSLPVIIMAQGWGGAQTSLFRDAAEFAQAGFYVTTFDFRGWGESDSRVVLTQAMPSNTSLKFTAEVQAIREVMDPLDMGMDWLNVLHWIHGERQVDTDNIGIWGSSMAGGFAIYAAANDLRVKAVHSQVTGTLNGRDMGRTTVAFEESTRRARGELTYPEPRVDWNGLSGYPIFARFPAYVPADMLDANDSVALQIVLAEKEEYGTNPGAMALYESHNGPKNLQIIPEIGHYGIYTTARSHAHGLAEAWFNRHLKRP